MIALNRGTQHVLNIVQCHVLIITIIHVDAAENGVKRTRDFLYPEGKPLTATFLYSRIKSRLLHTHKNIYYVTMT